MGTVERRKREKARKEDDIVETAKQLFLERGYEATKIDDIADRLEVSKGTIYLYFANKEEIYFAVAKEGLKIVVEMFREASGNNRTGIKEFEAIGHAYVKFWNEYPEYMRLFNSTMIRTAPTASGPHGAEFAAIGAEGNAIMVEAIRTGIRDGTIRGDISPEMAVFCISSSVTGVLERMERMGPSISATGLDREKVLAVEFKLLLRAVSK
ncbi:MAG TPA: TetR/AcrR family transcriptional regulator [Methanomassiliicoccales archaeon]